MSALSHVRVPVRPLDALAPGIGDERVSELEELAAAVTSRMPGGVVWNVNSTARGGGVAEMLRSIVGYARGAGIDCRWVVVSGPPEFFVITKRLHNALHGFDGDGSELGAAEQALYTEVCERNANELAAIIRPGDVVILHDPQTAGCIEILRDHGARVIWRCHIGTDESSEETARGWRFIAEHVKHAEVAVFSRTAYVPESLGIPHRIIQPTIDPLSPKNQPMTPESVASILSYTGILQGERDPALNCFTTEDGGKRRIDRRADVQRLGPAPAIDDPIVAQISRWDRLKDHEGVLHGFSEALDRLPANVHLVLAGPNVNAVADDPEGATVYQEVLTAWRRLPHPKRHHVHLVNLPMKDVEENAAIVNALQRHARIIVQKSLREGFGLTVAEGMWKGRAVVASRVGGIQDQIEHERTGLLIDDPTDTSQLAAPLVRLFRDPELSDRLGQAAHEAVRERFLNSTSLEQYGRLIVDLLS